jgi:AraC-like DNA-binding protein
MRHAGSVPASRRRRFQEPTAPPAEAGEAGELAAPPVSLLVSETRLALSGVLGPISHHHHACPAIVVGVDGPLRFVAGATRQSRAALLAPGFAHAVDHSACPPRLGGGTGRVAVFMLPAGAALHHEPLHELQHPGEWLELAAAVAGGRVDSFEPIERGLRREGLEPRPVDRRLRRALDRLARDLGDNHAVEEVAAAAGLSPTRLMALAREQLGTSLRSYRRWLRAFHVVRQYATGASLTAAALEAGFSSSAHLSAAAREQFGIRPSQLLTPHTRPAIRAV